MSWTITDLRSVLGYTPSIGYYVSLALDTLGNPHISAHNYTSPDKGVYYFWYDGSWHFEKVEEGGERGQYTSIGLDTSDTPYISYYDQDSLTYNSLRYAYKSSGTWYFHSLGYGTNDVGSYSCLKFDGDKPRIVSIDRTNKKVIYHYYNGSWSASEPCNGRSYTSLVIDSSGNPHIAFVNGTGLYADLCYAYYDGSWHYETIDNVSDWGYVCIAMYGSTVHISCVDIWNAKLVDYYGSFGSWTKRVVSTLESSSGAYCWTSVAVDSVGNPFIAYLDDDVGKLKYDYWYGGKWLGGVIDTGLDIEESEDNYATTVSVAIDVGDNVHIGYSYNSYTVKYATNSLSSMVPSKSHTTLDLPPTNLISFGGGIAI